MVSATPSYTPGFLPVSVKILDQQRRLVADLGAYLAPGVISSILLNATHFVPELSRTLVIRDDLGTSIGFHGTSSDGQPLPDGFYRVLVKQGSSPAIEVTFYLEHQPWSSGSVVVVLAPKASSATICWSYGEAVNLRFDLYNLAGELVWQSRVTGQTGRLAYPLLSSSGLPIAGGIYILKAQASSLDGSVDDLRIVKMAVVR